MSSHDLLDQRIKRRIQLLKDMPPPRPHHIPFEIYERLSRAGVDPRSSAWVVYELINYMDERLDKKRFQIYYAIVVTAAVCLSVGVMVGALFGRYISP